MFIPPGFVNVNYRFLRDGDPELMLTSFGFEWDELPDGVDFANDMFTAWADSTMQGITTEATTLASVTCEFGTIGEGNLVSESTLPGVNGAAAEEVCPPNCALLVKKLTGLGGRANRGRNYYPDVQNAAVNASGVIDSASLEEYIERWLDWGTNRAVVDGATTPVLFHSEDESIPTPLSGFAVQSKIATQRRRLRP